MRKPLVLFGAGGMARETVPLIDEINRVEKAYEFLGFVVERKYYVKGAEVSGKPVLGDTQWLLDRKDAVFCTCAIGDPQSRSSIQESLRQRGVIFESLVSPCVRIDPSTTIGEGSVIYADVRLSVDCAIGRGVFLNCGATVGHDAHIGDYACIMPGTGISGHCDIGERVLVGGHAFIVSGRRIGSDAVVAAGSIVFSNVKGGTTVLGNPAKRMSCLE